MLRSVAALLCCGALAAQAQIDDATVAKLRGVGEATIRDTKIPGISLAVRAANGAVWTEGFGLADVENRVPATEKTMYRTASIAKPMTAVVVMRLMERNKLDLDTPVSKVLEEWPAKRWPVTPRRLMSHLGGVRHYEGASAEVRSNVHYRDVVDALEIFASDPLLHEPGTKYRYTTYGFNLLGALAQRAGDAKFPALLETHVFAPAGMESTRTDDAWAIIPHRAQGYWLWEGEIYNSTPVDTSNKIPGGGLCCTAVDLVHFGAAMLDGKLVEDETRDAMWTEQKTTAGDAVGYGLGFSVGKDDAGRRIVGHGGAQSRVRTLLRMWPDEGIVVGVMCNLEGSKLGPIAADLATVARSAR